jgi:hypothetical protein
LEGLQSRQGVAGRGSVSPGQGTSVRIYLPLATSPVS